MFKKTFGETAFCVYVVVFFCVVFLKRMNLRDCRFITVTTTFLVELGSLMQSHSAGFLPTRFCSFQTTFKMAEVFFVVCLFVDKA